MKPHKIHLRSVADSASCGQLDTCYNITDDHSSVTCRFCLGILKLRRYDDSQHYHRLQWLPYRLHGNDVWASCDEKGRLCVEPDSVVTVVYALPARDNKRYPAHYRNLVPR